MAPLYIKRLPSDKAKLALSSYNLVRIPAENWNDFNKIQSPWKITWCGPSVLTSMPIESTGEMEEECRSWDSLTPPLAAVWLEKA